MSVYSRYRRPRELRVEKLVLVCFGGKKKKTETKNENKNSRTRCLRTTMDARGWADAEGYVVRASVNSRVCAVVSDRCDVSVGRVPRAPCSDLSCLASKVNTAEIGIPATEGRGEGERVSFHNNNNNNNNIQGDLERNLFPPLVPPRRTPPTRHASPCRSTGTTTGATGFLTARLTCENT